MTEHKNQTTPSRGPVEPRTSGKAEDTTERGKPNAGAATPGRDERAAAAERTSGKPAPRPSGSQASHDQTKVGDDTPQDKRSEETKARHQLIREQTRPLTPDEVRPRETAQNKKPEDRPARPGHEIRMREGGRGLRVQALKDLFHENRRIRAGEVFDLTDPKKFKASQMVEVTSERPARSRGDIVPEGFPFAKAANVRRGIPGMPRERVNPRSSFPALEEGMVAGGIAARDGLTPEQRKDHDFGNTAVTSVEPEALPDPDQRPALSPNEAQARDQADGLLE
jgi:hypothetical protein